MNRRDIIKALALTSSFRDVFFLKSVLIIERPGWVFLTVTHQLPSDSGDVVNIKLSLLIRVSLFLCSWIKRGLRHNVRF